VRSSREQSVIFMAASDRKPQTRVRIPTVFLQLRNLRGVENGSLSQKNTAEHHREMDCRTTNDWTDGRNITAELC
jgi:hypothetical protein